MKIEWIFMNDTHWVNTCDKCCNDCDKDYKTCKEHCANVFVNDGFCGGCKYDD